MAPVFSAFVALLGDNRGLTSTEYSTMGGAMAGTVSDMAQNLAGASSSAFDAVTEAVMAITG